jgi:hypothetical protein
MHMKTSDLIESISRAAHTREPFHFLTFRDFFPPDVYAQMASLLPPLPACHELRHKDAIGPDGKSTRLQFGFSDKEFRAMEQDFVNFWLPFRLAITAPDVLEALRNALSDGMRRGFGDRWDKVRLSAHPFLVRDQSAFRIDPHPDIPQKAITFQIYLPRDDSQRDIGTVFYKEDGGKFHKMDFLPNSGHAFAVTNHSLHGVETVPPDAGCRDSLLMFLYFAA